MIFSYGIPGSMHDWFKSYLNTRQRFAAINDSISSNRNITCEVPRGSIIRPLFFILYLNDLHKALNEADDTNIFAIHKNSEQVVDSESNSLSNLLTSSKRTLYIYH